MRDLQSRLTQAVDRLQKAGVDSAARDARLIVAHAHGIDPSRLTLYLRDDCGWGAAQENYFLEMLEDRANHRPVAKIIGRKAFWGRDFWVTDDVLDPRPETETLVAAALGLTFQSVLDLGTGSGAIIVSLLADRPAAHGVGVDVSQEALQVARQNADSHGIVDRAKFVKADLFNGVTGQRFDLIVSNPPYLAAYEMEQVPKDTLHDPRIALTDEADGMTFYRLIADQAGDYLTQTGCVLVEIGPTQGASVRAMFQDAGFQNVAILPDLDGRDRVVVAKALENV